MKPKVVIVTTLRSPGASLESFIRYHLGIGFAHIYLFFDDPEDDTIPITRAYDQVTTILHDAELRQQWRASPIFPEVRDYIDCEVMARQRLNAHIAIERAKTEGYDWLLHIDIDELFWSPNTTVADHFAAVDRSQLRLLRYFNHEAVPEALEINNCFRDVSLFKTNPYLLSNKSISIEKHWPAGRNYFLAYTNGKSAVKLVPGVLPDGVHLFKFPGIQPQDLRAIGQPVILHYPNCGFEQYWQKYKILGNFSDAWFGRLPISRTIGAFHTESRDTILGGDRPGAISQFQEQVMINDANMIEELLERGILQRIKIPLTLLSETA